MVLAGAFALGGALVGVALAFDDATLSQYQLKIWDLGLKTLGGIVVAGASIGGAIRYFRDRRDRLAWDKTRFIVELFSAFDGSATMQRALMLVDHAYRSGDDAHLRKVLSSTGKLSKRQAADRHAVDRYLDFFDRLMTHVFITRTLTVSEISSFSGYITQLPYIPAVKNYAVNWGYEDVIRFASQLESEANDREALAVRLEDSTFG